MKIKKLLLFIVTALSSVVLFSCSNYEETDGAWNNPAGTGYPGDPVISSVSPSDSLIAGVREIVITGQNFSSNPENNWVYFGDERAILKSATSTQVVAYRPQISGDVQIKYLTQDALPVLHVNNYKIEAPVAPHSDFLTINTNLFCMETDQDDNLWVATRRALYTVTPAGQLSLFVEDMTPSTVFSKMTDLRFGPGGFLYIAVDRRDIYRINTTAAGNAEVYVNIPKAVDFMDFDFAGNLYCAKGDGIYIVDANKSVTFSGHYADVDITGIRVTSNTELYVSTESKIYRNTISGGTLGADQVVFDLSTAPGFTGAVISSFNIDANGRILVGIKNYTGYSLFILENGVPVPYYYDSIVPMNIDQLVWGAGRYLYLNRGTLPRDSVRVYRMGMDVNGAPYPGR